MESVLMTTPSRSCANSSASADLPLAVGPAISTALTVSASFVTLLTRYTSIAQAMSLVATLICNPASPSLDSTVVDAVRAILPGSGAARWLFEGVAADIPFANPEDRGAVIKRLREALGDLPVD